MLQNLSIRNIVLIEKLDISFANGFGVLTGETGAGKSILLGSLGFVLGRKPSAGLLRAGSEQGSVTATFSIQDENILAILKENAIPMEDELTLRRVIYKDNKSKAFINDEPISVNILANISQYLVEIHGQHEQRGLLDSSEHISILDKYGQYLTELQNVKESYVKYNALKKELSEIENLAKQDSSEVDYLTYILQELEKLNPQNGEEVILAEKRNRLMGAEKISSAINSASHALSSTSIAANLLKAQSAIESIINIEPNLQNVVEAIQRASIEVEEASFALDKISSSLDFGNENLDKIEERLFALRGAARKYRVTVDELPLYLSNIRQKLDNINNKENKIKEISMSCEKAKGEFTKCAKELTIKREKAAQQFQNKLMAELAPLKMENTKLKVQIEELHEESWNMQGIDKVIFLVSTNPGMPFSPLAKIASGGELSRFMLAMKVVLSNIKSVPTLIFDEVDTGIGGAVADSVGRRMKLLGNNGQVLAVTHHPQVAAHSSFHLFIMKEIANNNTLTKVRQLNTNEKQKEIARMLAGEKITEEALAAAGKLMEA